MYVYLILYARASEKGSTEQDRKGLKRTRTKRDSTRLTAEMLPIQGASKRGNTNSLHRGAKEASKKLRIIRTTTGIKRPTLPTQPPRAALLPSWPIQARLPAYSYTYKSLSHTVVTVRTI